MSMSVCVSVCVRMRACGCCVRVCVHARASSKAERICATAYDLCRRHLALVSTLWGSDEKSKTKKTKKKVKQMPAPAPKKGPNYDILKSVDGLVKTSSGRYIKAAE
jgi:hypothetical protein